MIRMQSVGGMHRNAVPVFVCDICGEPITDVSTSAAMYRHLGHGEEDIYEAVHVHKGRCMVRIETTASFGPDGPWQELAEHIIQLVTGTGMTIRSMIELATRGGNALTPHDYDELQSRLSELSEWLRECGVDSPLWNDRGR